MRQRKRHGPCRSGTRDRGATGITRSLLTDRVRLNPQPVLTSHIEAPADARTSAVRAESTKYFLSTTDDLSGVVSPPLATNDYSVNLAPGESTIEQEQLTIPANVGAGTYYIVAQLDADQSLDPNDTNNIASCGPIAIYKTAAPAVGVHLPLHGRAEAGTAGPSSSRARADGNIGPGIFRGSSRRTIRCLR